jgi:predicted ATPase
MKISAIYTKGVGPLADGVITFENDWTEELESKILLTGPNGCGKSTVLRAVAMLWEAAGFWLDHGRLLPQTNKAKAWLHRWEGIAVVFENLLPNTEQPLGLIYGGHEWVSETLKEYAEIGWLGGEIVGKGIKRNFFLDCTLQNKEVLKQWEESRKRLILTHDKVDAPNLIYLDAEERSWVAPKRRVSEPLPDPLTQRWLTKYAVTEDWQGQLEASLINLKTTQLHKYHDVIRDLNQFLVGKEIDPDIKPGEGRLRVKLKGQRGASHSLDELSAGEHQVLILIYLISRWMQPGGVVLIDEPDLYLHPSLISSLLASIEQLVHDRGGQLIITSHAVDVWHRYENQGKRIELKARGESL